MTGGAPMRCEDARELLVELACGEPMGELRAQVQAHAQRCSQCGPELAKFSRVLEITDQLPLSEPSPRVEGRVMLAAREALAAHGGSAPARGFWQGASKPTTWLGRLSRWAMSPQVAMASVLLLMVGIGLYALPLGRKNRQVAFETAREERVAPDPAASATALPQADEERVLEQLAKEEKAREASAATRGQRSATRTEGTPSAAQPRDDGLGALRQERKRRASKGSTADKETLSPAEPLTKEKLEPAPAAASKPRTSVSAAWPSGGGRAPAPEASAASEDLALRDSSPQAFAPPPPAKASAARHAEAPASPPADQGDWAKALQQGVAAARGGNHARAVSVLEPVSREAPPQLRRQAYRWIAHSLRAQGDCAGAIRYYEFLVRSAQVGAEVLREAGDCFERVGDAKRAEELRSRASAQ